MASRGRPRQFALPDVLDAALLLIEEEGVGALSMQALAARLGTGSATLYNYVGSRDELIDLMLGRALSGQPELPQLLDSDDWAQSLVAYMVASFRVALARPALMQLMQQRPTLHLGVVARGQDELLVLEGVGFSATRAAEVYRILASQLIGHLWNALAVATRPDSALAEVHSVLGAAQQHLDALGEEQLYESAVRTVVLGLAAELALDRNGVG